MNTKKYIAFFAAITLTLSLLMPFAYGGQAAKGDKKAAAKKEFIFHGKVEKVDPQTKMLTINGEKVEGWMAAMTMAYRVDKEDTLKQVKVGDQITAKVYEGDLILHEVKVVPAGAEKKTGKSAPKK
jgi:Cu/Ag efflux protein CusF